MLGNEQECSGHVPEHILYAHGHPEENLQEK